MNIELPINIRTKTVSVEELFTTFNREEVLGYCQHCHNYGDNHSCPDSNFDESNHLKEFPWVTLILTEASTSVLEAQLTSIADKKFESQVMKSYGEGDVFTAISMQAFNIIKDQMASLLLELEQDNQGSISSPPGSCTKCDPCTKVAGADCMYPEELRYSLEAYGFKVSEIYEEFFDCKLQWTKDSLPSAYHSCGALFTKVAIDANALEERLSGVLQTIQLTYRD